MRLFYARFLIGGVLGLQPVDLRFGLLHSGLIAFEQRNEHGRRFAMGLRNFLLVRVVAAIGGLQRADHNG